MIDPSADIYMTGLSFNPLCGFSRSFDPITSADLAIKSFITTLPSDDFVWVRPNNATPAGETYTITYQLKTESGTLVASVPITIEIKA